MGSRSGIFLLVRTKNDVMILFFCLSQTRLDLPQNPGTSDMPIFSFVLYSCFSSFLHSPEQDNYFLAAPIPIISSDVSDSV